MNIDQELERLHKSFQINQERNSGDKSADLLFLISTIHYHSVGEIQSKPPVMDMSLKDEMTRGLVLQRFSAPIVDGAGLVTNKKDDNHGFDIPEELQSTFDKFKQFLKDNDAEVYWTHIKESGNYVSFKKPIYTWIDRAFHWMETAESWSFWDSLDKKWRGSLK